MDECNIDEIEIRRRPSRRHPNQSLFARMSHKKSPLRTNSLNVRGDHKPDRMTVTRNISSPTTMQHPTASNQQRYTATTQMICYQAMSNYLSKIIDFCFSFFFRMIKRSKSFIWHTAAIIHMNAVSFFRQSTIETMRNFDFRQFLSRMSFKRKSNVSRKNSRLTKPLSAANSIR